MVNQQGVITAWVLARASLPYSSHQIVKLNRLAWGNQTSYTYEQLLGTFVHELGHTLGLMHEHQRADSPVTSPGQETAGAPLGPYDPHSIMNYFSTPTNGLPYELSFGDIWTIQFLYGTASQYRPEENFVLTIQSEVMWTYDAEISTWSWGEALTLPLVSNGEYDFYVDWGDGTTSHISSFDDPDVTHPVKTAGAYQIRITGKIEGWSTLLTPYQDLSYDEMDIMQFGNLEFGDTYGQFYDCDHLNIYAEDSPGLANTTSFHQASSHSDVVFIDTDVVWHTSSITHMSEMFYEATQVKALLYNWDTTNVTDMRSMFQSSIRVNSSAGLKTRNVEDMSYMFADSADSVFICITQGGDMWNTSNVNNMKSMFENATGLDRLLIHRWETGNVTDMSNMFKKSDAKIESSGYGDRLRWDTGNVTDMTSMFEGATNFNSKPIVWDVRNVTSVQNMFKDAERFDQDLSTLWFENNEPLNMEGMLDNTGLSTENYGHFLGMLAQNQWALPHDVTLSARGIQHDRDGERHITNLQRFRNWTIIDGGRVDH